MKQVSYSARVVTLRFAKENLCLLLFLKWHNCQAQGLESPRIRMRGTAE